MNRRDSTAEDRATMELFGERIDRSTRCGQTSEDAIAPVSATADTYAVRRTNTGAAPCRDNESQAPADAAECE